MSTIRATLVNPAFRLLRSLNAADLATMAVAGLVTVCDATLPRPIAQFFTSIHGAIFLVFSAAVMLLYTKPLTGLIAVYVAYRLAHARSPIVPADAFGAGDPAASLPGDVENAVPMKQSYVPAEATLEEAIVRRDAPVGEASGKFVMTPAAVQMDPRAGPRPVASDTFGAAPYY